MGLDSTQNVLVSSRPRGNCSLFFFSFLHLFFSFCSLFIESQHFFFSRFLSDIVAEKQTVFTSSFVSQLQVSHGSVLKSGLKLLQMFSNERLRCQHEPTSTSRTISCSFMSCRSSLLQDEPVLGSRYPSVASSVSLQCCSEPICPLRKNSCTDASGEI